MEVWGFGTRRYGPCWPGDGACRRFFLLLSSMGAPGVCTRVPLALGEVWGAGHKPTPGAAGATGLGMAVTVSVACRRPRVLCVHPLTCGAGTSSHRALDGHLPGLLQVALRRTASQLRLALSGPRPLMPSRVANMTSSLITCFSAVLCLLRHLGR